MDNILDFNEDDFDETMDDAKDKLWNNSQPIIESIVDELSHYDIFDFLVRLSALNLLPKNQNKCTVLDLIVDAILKRPVSFFSERNILSASKFKTLINKAMSAPIAAMIDPIEAPFLYRVQFYGDYWILPGLSKSAGYNLNNLINSVRSIEKDLPEVFSNKFNIMTDFILSLSNSIVSLLGYDINTLGHYEIKHIDFPNSDEHKKLAKSITFSQKRVKEHLGKDIYKKLLCNFNAPELISINKIDNLDFFYHPFLEKDDDTLILLNPSCLAHYLIHYIIELSKEFGINEKIISQYNNKTFLDCKKSLDALGHKRILASSLGVDLIETSCYKEDLLTVANDGLLLLQMFCDDGSSYDKDMFGFHHIDMTHIDGRSEYVKNHATQAPANRLYQLVIIHSFGRGTIIAFENKQFDKIIRISPMELMCISINERNHNNFLARYMDARYKLAEIKYSPIDEINYIATYTHKNYSFYMDDTVDVRKTFLYPAYGDSVDYLNDALQKEDKQLVSYPLDDIYYREVRKIDPTRSIYGCTNQKQLHLLIRFSNIDIWVDLPTPSDENSLYISKALGDLITYWLTECKDSVESRTFNVDSLVIIAELNGDFNNITHDTIQMDAPLSELLKVKIENRSVILNWSPESFYSLDGETNSREKELTCILLEAIFNFTSVPFKTEETSGYFNDPLKKKVHSLNCSDRPDLAPTLTESCIIPMECEEEILDEIGYFFKDKYSARINDFKEKPQDQICREVVDYLYSKLVLTIEDLSPDHILHLAYSKLEANLYYQLLLQRRYVYDKHCHPEDHTVENNFNEINKASLSLKFLVEYVAAKPPKGTKILGLLDFEYILALCSSIIEWAHQSDLFKYEIIDDPISLLDSGRLGYNKEKVSRYYSEEISASKKRLLSGSMPTLEAYTPTKSIKNLPELIDDAFIEEFSYSFSQATKVLLALFGIGATQSSDVKEIKIKASYKIIADDTKLDQTIISKIINDFSLSCRDDFLIPPEGFDSFEVYPWRYNRRLSFNRRPIIKYGDNLLWGNRQLYHSISFLFSLITNGKLYATKPKLKRLKGQLTNNGGHYFNDVVARKIKSFSSVISDSKVTKINKKHIQSDDKKDLGDIDLLIILPRKKKIIVAEVKDFEFTKCPYEMHRQYEDVFCDKKGKLCYMSRHNRRVEWVSKHMADVIAQYNLPDGKWKVESLLITSEAVIGSKLFKKDQKAMLYTEITEKAINKL